MRGAAWPSFAEKTALAMPDGHWKAYTLLYVLYLRIRCHGATVSSQIPCPGSFQAQGTDGSTESTSCLGHEAYNRRCSHLATNWPSDSNQPGQTESTCRTTHAKDSKGRRHTRRRAAVLHDSIAYAKAALLRSMRIPKPEDGSFCLHVGCPAVVQLPSCRAKQSLPLCLSALPTATTAVSLHALALKTTRLTWKSRLCRFDICWTCGFSWHLQAAESTRNVRGTSSCWA